jgi:hypothetical protein
LRSPGWRGAATASGSDVSAGAKLGCVLSREIGINWASPEGRIARARALRLIAARVGAGKLADTEGQAAARRAYGEEFNRVVQEMRASASDEHAREAAWAHLTDALVQIGNFILIMVAPGDIEDDDEDEETAEDRLRYLRDVPRAEILASSTATSMR